MLRRVIGLAGVADLNTIGNDQVRAEAERLALAIGQALILERKAIGESADLTAIVRRETARFYQEATA
jgi:5-methylthioribose kinase